MLHLYLDHMHGNDSNDGLSATNAKKTEDALYPLIESGCTIHADVFLDITRFGSHSLMGFTRLTMTSNEMEASSAEYMALYHPLCL